MVANMQALTAVAEGSISGRAIGYYNAGPMVMLRGVETKAPDLVCEKCQEILVQGVSRSRFIDPAAAQAVGVQYIRLTPPRGSGNIFMSKTLPIRTASDHVEAIVLCCSKCRTFNDTLKPPSVQ